MMKEAPKGRVPEWKEVRFRGVSPKQNSLNGALVWFSGGGFLF
jgi:hypothetical protein